MKNKIYILIAVFALSVFHSCDPNKDLYNQLDKDQKPYSEEISYTLTEADYNSVNEVVEEYQAFNDTIIAMHHIPDILTRRFNTLKLNSAAIVTYNQFMIHPDWWNAGFGYEMQEEDYGENGANVDGPFTPTNPLYYHIQLLLTSLVPNAEEGDIFPIIYMYLDEDEGLVNNLDIYQLENSLWTLLETQINIPYIGYELSTSDYENFDGWVASNQAFDDEDYPSEVYLPILLKNMRPYAVEGDVQVLKFEENNDEKIDKYKFDGLEWNKVPYTKEVTEQYIYGTEGWAFNPAVKFQMNKDDYMYLAVIDPIPHPFYNDFGYYYGSSAFYSNFDIRLIGRRLQTDDDGNPYDPELVEIHTAEGVNAAKAEMMRRIGEEGIILLLQHKFPNATPQVGGIDVHYTVYFQTFADGSVRAFPEAEYICTAAGSPPQFELIRGPEEPDSEEE